jgi:hypothetical protein
MDELYELRRELRWLSQERSELADGGRYYLYDPDTAERDCRLGKQIEELHARIEALTSRSGG